ncbi:ABC transporter substrate-binding protein [Chloroflexi bacterium TSY]|nr:ABC transporter substrate-binding protein [Chloroflexi bacterium TSY]
MQTKRLSRRGFLQLSASAAAGTMLLAACPAAAPSPGSDGGADQEVITLLIDAGGGTPSADDVAEDEKRVGFQEAAEAYMELHPNIKIEWYHLPPGSNRSEWLQARMTAKDSPDTFWYNADALWPHIHKGWALDLSEFVILENPYMEGKEPWVDYIDEVGRLSQIGPDGKIYGVNLDGAGVLILVNKDAMAEAGVEQDPKTWGEFMNAWQALQEIDYIPFGGDMSQQCCYAHWTHGHVFNQLAWDVIMDFDETNDAFITAKELVQHTQRGDWPLWDHFVGMAHFFKEQAPFLPNGYQGQVEYRQLFRQNKLGMYMEGNWTIAGLKKDPPPFEFDWLTYPIITKDIWPDAPEKHIRLQGPWGGLQFHIPGYLAEEAPEKIPHIIDFLMFVTQPEYVSASCAERGTIPMVRGSTTIPEMQPFLEPFERAVAYQSWASLSGSAYERERALLAEYMPGGMSDDALVAQAQEIWDDEVSKSLENNPDWQI